MIKIGFVDFFLSEWHANNYPTWIKETGKEFEVAYAWAEKEVSPYDGITTNQWCETMGVQQCGSIEEVCEKSDVIVILSPDNPENHLPYAKIVLPYGKPTYIDKPFAHTKEDAEEMLALAQKYNTPFFSTSALRYATELDEVEECTAVATLGGGAGVEQYIIHQIEMIVKKLGLGAQKIMARKLAKNQYHFLISYSDGRAAMMHYAAGAPFEITMSPKGEDNVFHSAITSAMFEGLIQDMLRFFETKNASFDASQTMEANKIYAASIRAKETLDTWIEV